MMTTTPIENHTLERLLDAWDTTVLPTHRDGAMQEWMEALRHEFTTCPDASITGRITGRITGLDPAPKAETDDRHAQELLAQDITIARALLEQVLEALDNIPHPPWRDKELADAIRAELAKPEPEETFIPDWANYRQGVADGKAGSPKWHDAPTEPGLWACVNSDGHRLFQEIASSGLKWVAQDGDRWYGPIPQDTKAEGEST